MIAALLVAGALAQAPTPQPVVPLEGSAWRLSEPWSPSLRGYSLHLYEDRADCDLSGVADADVEACLPWVDPARHQLHLAFDVRAGDQRVPVALDEDRLMLALAGEGGLLPVPRDALAVVPHEPAGFRQLFVLVIDRSSSMYEASEGRRPPMEQVVGTLLSGAVRRTFFPEGPNVRTGVLLLTFTDALEGVNGQPWQDVEILEAEDDYAEAVDQLLYVPPAGWTHLYDAVETVVDEVLVDPDVSAFRVYTQAEPAVVVLTDGFHDPRASWTCGDNASPLTRLLARVRDARTTVGRTPPTLHAVGFGQGHRPDFELPPWDVDEVTPAMLCGDAADQRIDGGLERRGIDNPSLALLADAGGGQLYVGEDARDLATFLAGAVRRLHRWYELYVDLDPAAHPEFRQRFRRPMPLALEVQRPLRVEAQVTFFPHPWFDHASAPLPADAAWSMRPRTAGVTGTLAIVLGATLGLLGLAVGGRHARRAVLRRASSGRGGSA